MGTNFAILVKERKLEIEKDCSIYASLTSQSWDLLPSALQAPWLGTRCRSIPGLFHRAFCYLIVRRMVRIRILGLSKISLSWELSQHL